MRERIHSAGPSITEKEINIVTDAITNGWYSSYRDYLELFQKSFSQYTQTAHAIATTSCTTAMHLAVKTLGLQPGDEVILPNLTWIATASVLVYEGIKPVFADIEKDTWTIDCNSVRQCISKKTKAIMPVDLYGHPCDYNELRKIANEYGLFILSDSAPAVGSLYENKPTASYADIACYSFQGAKIIITGEGGILVTNSDDLFERADFLVDDGRDETKATFWINEIGFHYRMANLLAALGYSQLQRIEEIVSMKRKQFDLYFERLSGVDGISMFKERTNCRANCSYPSILLDPKLQTTRDELRARLKSKNIDTRPIFPVLNKFPMFSVESSTPVSEYVAANGMNLPTPAYLNESDVDYICETIIDIIK